MKRKSLLGVALVALGFSTQAGTAVAAAPGVTTGPARNVGQLGASLRGTVDPNRVATTYFFQYGTTRAYSATTPEAADSGLQHIPPRSGAGDQQLLPAACSHRRSRGATRTGLGPCTARRGAKPLWLRASRSASSTVRRSTVAGSMGSASLGDTATPGPPAGDAGAGVVLRDLAYDYKSTVTNRRPGRTARRASATRSAPPAG